ncbi:hypothetical protein BT93_L5031 [Corymbia citriodora subsp. variegata]|uniref:Uncharacterized protein n=1 Tax=Corymbia citriodora subsp. variegata TaxID=360336 RepID=A0A8T0CVL2_CORYI|nr:hypothetical protein BT93_L5031 [Corymbia citriodora subsp. variegata]
MFMMQSSSSAVSYPPAPAAALRGKAKSRESPLFRLSFKMLGMDSNLVPFTYKLSFLREKTHCMDFPELSESGRDHFSYLFIYINRSRGPFLSWTQFLCVFLCCWGL